MIEISRKRCEYGATMVQCSYRELKLLYLTRISEPIPALSPIIGRMLGNVHRRLAGTAASGSTRGC